MTAEENRNENEGVRRGRFNEKPNRRFNEGPNLFKQRSKPAGVGAASDLA